MVQKKYEFQPIQGVNKLINAYLAAGQEGTHTLFCGDNRLLRVSLENLFEDLIDFRGDSGYFYEYDCQDTQELKVICGNTHCQTIPYIGNAESFLPLIKSGIRGVDRIVPVGKRWISI